MFISASRRTDIPRFFYEWFLNRLREGYVLVRNPINPQQVSRIRLDPEVLDAIIFWTKDPAPMLGKLNGLEPYPYYIQFTLNPYGSDVEHSLPPKKELLQTFRQLSEELGPERVVWRYSPVLYTQKYTAGYHLRAFGRLAEKLDGQTRQCKLSFLDLYPKIKKRMREMGVENGNMRQNIELAKQFAAIGKEHGIEVSACGNLDIQAAGIPPAKCIDDRLISKLTGYSYRFKKDPGQRADCYCAASIDIGAYDTCGNGCQYCYANFSQDSVRRSMRSFDVRSPMLCDSVQPGDKVSTRKVVSNKILQRSLFD